MDRWTAAIRAGDFDSAWAMSAAWLALRDPATRDDPRLPYHKRWVWDGRPFDGCDVLVRCYHGLGDTIQFARYLPLLARRAASLTVETQPSLVPLLSGIAPNARFVPFDQAHPSPPAACDIEITELPFALREGPLCGAPYLTCDAEPLPAGTIGLCYEGGDWDRSRSIAPDAFTDICATNPVFTLVGAPTTLPVLNPQGCPMDMIATARAVAACALVVTVDTMIAHLAGALGRPTALLLKADPDWRWTPGAATTPWYASMRLYHQTTPGDWSGPIAQLTKILPRQGEVAPKATEGEGGGAPSN
ncbi:hypothetical protein [Sphingomonas sp. ID0503]|uniref:hypothetical protein n=1 Tax=Sphingomonas sp. ID0503 TaxID=3399691 RepID=UPI003AFB68F8